MQYFNGKPEISRMVESSFSSHFSNSVNKDILESAERIVIDFVKRKTTGRDFYFLPEPGWLAYQLVKVDGRSYLFGIFLEHSTAELNVIIEDFMTPHKGKQSTQRSKILSPGRIKSVKVSFSPNLKFDCGELLYLLYMKIESDYNGAIVDFRSAIQQFADFSGADCFYQVLRKSLILKNYLKNISLYCVFEKEGRHLPSVERIIDIVPRISKGIQNIHVCPLSISSDFFLTPLSGAKDELYTQRSYRAKQVLTATKNTYSGSDEQYWVKMSTQAFFEYGNVNVQFLIASADDKWLLSAIYPQHLGPVIESELKSLAPEFTKVMEDCQHKNRTALDKLKLLYVSPASTGKKWTTAVGEIFNGFINA